MRRKGLDFKRASHLTFRDFNPETDVEQCHGYDRDYFARNPSRGAYVVIVPTSRCVVGNDGYLTRESVDAAKCLPFNSWSRTNMVYGHPWRRQTRGTRVWLRFSDPIVTDEERDAWKAQSNSGATDEEWMEHGMIAKWFPVYWTSTVYWVEDNRVYTASIRTHIDPTAQEA